MATLNLTQNMARIPPSSRGGLSMLGQIPCARSECRTRMEGDTCPKCGGARCLINVYWKGKQYEYRQDEPGDNSIMRKLALTQCYAS